MKFLNDRSVPVLAILLILLIIGQQTLAIGGKSVLSLGIHNSAHGPWFALVTYLIWRIVSVTFLSNSKFVIKLGFTIVIAFFIALMSEFGEQTNGRVASWEDLFRDMCGAVSAILFIVASKIWKGKPPKNQNPVLFILAGLLLIFSLYPFFFAVAITLHHKEIQPRLLGFSSYLDYATMSTTGETQLMTAPKTWTKFSDQQVMKISLPEAKWPGFRLTTPTSNWSSYSNLLVEIFNDSTIPLPLKISIRTDSPTDDGTTGFYLRFELAPGANTVRVPINDFLYDREKIEWRVRHILIYTLPSFGGSTVYVGEIRLD